MAKILDDEEGVILRNGQVTLEYRDDLNLYGAVYSANGWKEIGSRIHSGKWAHYSLVNDSQFIRLYINGNLMKSRLLEGEMNWENIEDRNLYIGTDSRLPWSKGGKIILDDFRIYDRALLENEIVSLYGYGTRWRSGHPPIGFLDKLFLRFLRLHNQSNSGKKMPIFHFGSGIG